MDNLTVILLAAGNSTRFVPLRDKNLYTFLGKTLVEIQLEKFASRKISNIVIVSNQNNYEQIKELAAKTSSQAQVVVQEGEGQAGAVETAIRNLSDDQQLLIVNLDDLFEDSLLDDFFAKLPELNANKNCLLTGYYTEQYFPGGYLVLDEANNVIDVKEKPGAGNEPSKYVRLVFDYFFSKKDLTDQLAKAQTDKDDKYEVALANMMKSGMVFTMLKYQGVWKTIKYPWHVLDFTEYYLNKIEGQQISPEAQVADSAIIKGNVIIEAGAKIFDGAIINGPAYIGKNTVVANNALVRSSIIGDDCVIGFASEVARSYLKNKVWLHMNYIGDSVVENNVAFGSTALTANFRLDEANISVNIKGEKIDSRRNKLGAIIGQNVRLGVGVKVMPGIKIGEDSCVASGVILNEDLAEKKYLKLKQEVEIRDNAVDISGSSREQLKSKL